MTYEELQARLKEAVRLLDLQRHRTQYRQDDQIKTQKQVAEFIEANK
jgi:hypothetical protein